MSALYRLLELLGAFAGALLFLAAFGWSARRFARRQRELGRWDEHGPLNPTDEPPDPKTHFLRRVMGRGS